MSSHVLCTTKTIPTSLSPLSLKMSSRRSWIDMFKEGKWKDCSYAFEQELNEFSLKTKERDVADNARRISLQNNLFICDQLDMNWECETEGIISQNWAKSYSRISELHRFLRCQHICNELPLDLVLCVAYNCMWWTVMKIDPFNQHFCQKEAMDIAVYSLKAAAKSLGYSPPLHQSTHLIESEFTKMAEDSIMFLTILSPIQCQLALEIIILGFIALLDDNQRQSQGADVDYQHVLEHLVDVLPQVKVHLSSDNSEEIFRKQQDLLKFGWKNVCDILSTPNSSTTSEMLLIVVAIYFLRNINKRDLKENSNGALKYLNLIDTSNLLHPFLFSYLCALSYFNMENPDTCLYHLKSTSVCSSNFFMQGRSNILKGQALLLQDKPAAALKALQSVQYKQKEVRIPFCAYLMGTSYQKLGKVKQQTEILDLLIECLAAESIIQPLLLSPLSGMEHKLLLIAHSQPEISYKDVLQCSVRALLPYQPKEAAEKLLKLLHVISIEMDGDTEDSLSYWRISELLHDTASAHLRAHSAYDAQQVCETALQFHNSRLDTDKSNALNFSHLQEDVIALILLAEAKDSLGSADVFEILNRCGKVLQSLVNKLTKTEERHEKILKLAKGLLARVFLHKALLNVKRKFEDDATACFQRALYWNNEDPEVILQFAHHLLDNNQLEESLALWRMYTDCTQMQEDDSDNIALSYILGERMSSFQRTEILQRLKSLS